MEITQNLNSILTYAKQEAQRLGSDQIQPEHLLLGILRLGKGKAYQLLIQSGSNPDALKKEIDKTYLPKTITEAVMSRTSQRLMRLAAIEAGYFGGPVGSVHLLLAILRERINLPSMILEHQSNITYESIEHLYPKPETPAEETNGQNAEMGQFVMMTPDNQQQSRTGTPTLRKYTRDLTQLAQEGKLDPVIGRKEEINRIIHILCRRKKNNPVLIGEPGVGKSAIVEGLAQILVKNNIPLIKGKRILSLNMSALVAGTSYRGQFEQRIQNLLSELALHPEIIIFIDEIHTIIGAGNAQGSLDAANILKPALARGEIQCIGATTTDEYRKSIEKDGALERRFQKVTIQPPTEQDTLRIVTKLAPLYEQHHHITYTKEAIKACVTLSERYLTDRSMPDKAIDAMDEAGAMRLLHPGNVVTQEDVAAVISMMSNIPVQRIATQEQDQLLHMDQNLLSVVIGQDQAVHKVVRAIRRSRLGLSDPNRPIGTFFFLGPTGVGKTFLAQSLAEQLFGKKDAVIRFDMSEYTEKHTVSLLVGAPPGYQAHEDGGKLTEAVRRKPYSVLLFDEIEKAHPDIFNVLLQLLDEGRLTDRQGRQIDFRHTVIILTSNVGTRRLLEFGAGIGFSAGEITKETATETLMKELKKTFPPEFVNRIDDIITFYPLSRETIAQILDVEIKNLQKRVAATGYRLAVTTKAREQLLAKAYDPLNGARPVKRAVQTYLEDAVTESILLRPEKKNIQITSIS